MQKIIRIGTLCLAVIMLVSVLAACGGNKGKFVGTWVELNDDGEPTDSKLVLANDGTGSISESDLSGSVTWSLEGDKIFLTESVCGMTETYECSYTFSGDTMTLTDQEGDVNVYRKSK